MDKPTEQEIARVDNLARTILDLCDGATEEIEIVYAALGVAQATRLASMCTGPDDLDDEMNYLTNRLYTTAKALMDEHARPPDTVQTSKGPLQ
jgi:hypothetical protein